MCNDITTTETTITSKMANKTSVEDLLVQFFGTELNTTTPMSVINVTEEWLNSSQKSLQVLFENYDGSTPEEEISTNSDINVKVDVEDGNGTSEIENELEFEQLFRMKRSTILDLSNEINNTKGTEIDMNLLICLWVLGNTKYFSDISQTLNIKQEDMYDLCEKYFEKIVAISSKYIFWPSYTEVLCIEKGFWQEYKFPGIVGIIGCLHLGVYVSKDDPEAVKYFNKSTENHTIVLQAVCDNNLLFRDIFTGYPGSNSIETILKASSLYRVLTDENSFLIKTKKHLLGGTEHPQLSTLLTPYSISKNKKLGDRELKFNELHSSVTYTVEKIFRMVENRFPRMKSLDTTSPKFASLAAGAICTLHNFCRLRNDNTGC